MNRKLYKIILYLLVSTSILFLATYVTGCLDLASSCETEVSRRFLNPNKSLQAITMTTDCGATTSPSYGVRIVESSDTTDEGIRENTILGSNTGVDIKWLSNDTLLITGADTTSGYTMKTHLILKKTNVEIRILYEE